MIRANRPIRAIKIGVSIANDDSRESIRARIIRCESPVPLRFHNFSHALDVEYSCARYMRMFDPSLLGLSIV